MKYNKTAQLSRAFFQIIDRQLMLRLPIAVEVVDVVAVEVDVDVVVVEIVVVVVVVVVVDVDGCISSSFDRHLVTRSSSLTSPPPVLTSQPAQSERGHRTYLSSSLTKRPLYGHLVLAVMYHETQTMAGNGVRVSL